MEAAFELPIQSPTGERIVIDRAAPAYPPLRPPSPPEAPSLSQLRVAHSRSSLSPKRLPGSSSAARAWLTAGKAHGARGDGEMNKPVTYSGGSLRELKLRRMTQPRGSSERPGARLTIGRPKKRTSPTNIPKSLLPATERKSQEENKNDRLARKEATDSGDKWDIAPDGSSAGREGRQFTVANVGNNGRIYLRPTVRPAHLRSPQPNFVFPMTPPGTAGLDILMQDKDKRSDLQQHRPQQQQQQSQPNQQEQRHEIQRQPQSQPLRLEASSNFYGSDWTPDQPSSPTALPVSRPRLFNANNTSRNVIPRPSTAGAVGGRPGGGHRRAISDSTIQDTSIARESEPGGFKIVITQPADDKLRAKTLEDLSPTYASGSAPHLEIAIPTWKIGSPRFTLRGTPLIRGSSYTPTEEPYSSRPSYFSPAFDHSHSLLEEDDSPLSPRQGIFERQKGKGQGIPSPLGSPRFRIDGEGPRPAYHSNYAVIVTEMFDSLTFKPACDDRTIVRFSPATNAITAATPPRLVAEITSPKFMDYDLVSDFFLTYRAFLDARDLLRMLVARLRWAVERDDEAGMVVRVRTFVAFRHWILNYFMDDFVIDYELRVLFCDLLNGFVNELSQDPRGRKVQLKILTELKKCWRRSCAQYWDGPDFDDSLGPDVPITPGGIAGHRNPTLDPTFWEQVAFGEVPDESEEDEGPNFLTHLQSPESMVNPEPGSGLHHSGGHDGHIDSVVLGDRPTTPENLESYNDLSARRQASQSITSLDIVSCSFPTKNMKLLQASMGQPLGAHPVEPSLVYSSSGPVAITPRALVGKRVRANDGQKTSSQGPQHKRNNSLTDSLRERASAMDKLLQKNNEILMALPYAGSLVRGAVFPPGQPYVEVLPPGTGGGVSRQTTLFQPFALDVPDSQKLKASAMSSQGMRKLLGSVRRALSTRGQTVSATQGNFINMAPIGPRGATTNRLPGTAIVPQARPRMNGFRPPVRIDLLGAKIAEDFKVAVREDASLDAAAQPGEDAPAEANKSPAAPEQQQQPGANVAQSEYSDSLFLGWTPGGLDNLVRPISDTGITTGSKSIVIVDGTLPLDYPAMSGALALPNSNNGSVEMFGETFLSVAADPTPPTTPPGQPMGTPRRSSYVLGQPAVRPSLSMDPLPPFVPDMDTLGHSSTTEPPRPLIADTSIRPSSDVLQYEPEDSIILPQRPVDNDEVNVTVNEVQEDITINKNPATNSFGLPSSPPIRRPTPSWIQGHSRHRSSRSHKSHMSHMSHKSSRSYGRRRFASYASGTAPPAGVLSFDATTYTDASVDDVSEAQAPLPLRALRRRPGGDLRAVTTVADLDQGPIRRSRSVGSLTTYSESIRGSFIHSRARGSGGFVDVISVDYTAPPTRGKEDTFSVGMLTDKKLKKRMSMFSAHSSKPVMRPSFEAEAQKLAQIPDDVDDDGGVESALLKLEGKFERKPKKLSFSEPPFKIYTPLMAAKGTAAPPLSGFLAPQPNSSHDNNHLTAEEKIDHRHRQIVHSDLAPSHQSMLSKLGQQSTVGGTELDAIESQYGGTQTDEPRGSSMSTSSHVPAFSPPPAFRPAAVPRMVGDVQSFLSESGESYSSIPLLDRGLTDDGRSKGAPTEEWANQSIFEEGNESSVQTPTGPSSGNHLAHQHSYEVVEKTESIEKIQPGDTMPQSPGQATDVSFLEDESDHASDLSSELSVEFPDENEENGIYGSSNQNAHPVRSNTVVSRLPAHPLGDPQIEPAKTPPMPFQEQHPGKLVEDIDIHDGHPPSPPITLVQALMMSPDTAKIPELHDFQVWEDKPLPPTPSPDGTAPNTLRTKQAEEAEVLNTMGLRSVFEQPPAEVTAKAEAARTFSVHLPFILAFESEILAQQFTLIEKDALHEIDWRELIEMRWKDAENGNARSWVDFLRNSDARGVEVVIARFNIMVKWAISEVILTQDLEERARCLIKFIHIAAHCRRYRNYATMSQITIALTSNEVSRLTQTWAMIPPSDARTLRDLEALVSPTRNFYSLRAEMEAVGIDNADAGCIPFVGIYTHDLLFNAQRPSEIASSPTTAPLVNFERCRFAASIVKTLLRLVEASALYNFQPIEGITERCLWMSALSDDDIRKYSDALE